MTSSTAERRLRAPAGRHDHRRLHRERDRHRHAAPRAQLGRQRRATAAARAARRSASPTTSAPVRTPPTSTTAPRLRSTLNGGTVKDAATNDATLTLPAVGGASSLGGQKNIVIDTTNPTATVTTPGVNGLTYNASSLPANLAGSSNDTGGSSTVSSVAVAIQDGAGNYWDGATFNQVAHLLQRHRRHRRGLDLRHRHPRRPADRRSHLHDHRPLHRRRRQHRHHDTHLRLRHHRPDGDERDLVDGRTAPTRPASRSRSRSPSARTSRSPARRSSRSTPAAPRTTAAARGTSTLTFVYTIGAGRQRRRPRLLDHDARSTLNGGTIKDAVTNNATLTLAAVGGANSLGGQKTIVVDTTNPTARSPPRPSTATPTTRRASRPTSPVPRTTPAARSTVSVRRRSRSRTTPATTGAAPPSTRPRSSTTPPAAPSPPGPTPPRHSSASSSTVTPTRSPRAPPTPPATPARRRAPSSTTRRRRRSPTSAPPPPTAPTGPASR